MKADGNDGAGAVARPARVELQSGARRALGVDPGTARLGYAVVEEYRSRLTLLACGCIETPKTLPMPQRLLQLFNELTAIVRDYAPREMAVEELFFAKNTTTIIAVGQARGVALLVAAEAGLAVSEYKPMHIKQAVHGYGLADKKQVGEMVKVLLGLPAVPKPDDAADAAAVAICHLHTSHLSTRL
ncbi:MAG TPA: crossover junction endodeoxyribonuclease RuvC [Ktedonobacterales bacterium]|nr:crossover junction endodeoxyribonuclease RuvC [Ktedonobacterales bacterium]